MFHTLIKEDHDIIKKLRKQLKEIKETHVSSYDLLASYHEENPNKHTHNEKINIRVKKTKPH